MVRGTIDDYLEHPPLAGDLFAVIEIADSSRQIDLGPKLRTYATARVPQYIVADLVNDPVVVHEEPHDDAYSRVTSLLRGVTVHVRAGDGHLALAVDQLLP